MNLLSAMTLTNPEKPFQYLLLLFYGDAKVVFYFFKKGSSQTAQHLGTYFGVARGKQEHKHVLQDTNTIYDFIQIQIDTKTHTFTSFTAVKHSPLSIVVIYAKHCSNKCKHYS